MQNATAFQECHFYGSKMEPPKRTGLMDYEINLRVDITSTFTQNNPPKRILLEDDQLSRSGLILQLFVASTQGVVDSFLGFYLVKCRFTCEWLLDEISFGKLNV